MPGTSRVISANPLIHETVAPQYLDNLKYYKYSGKDNSFLSFYVLKHWWNFAVTLLPRTMAANLVTLVGFIISMVGPVLVIHHLATVSLDPSTVPSLYWIISGCAIFAYQTLDAIDGKQARRTFAQGPLGELFDHGCDVLQCPFDFFIVAVVCNYRPERVWWQFLLGGLGMIMAIIEQYSTGTLDLGYINGPVEGLLIMAGIFLWTGLGAEAGPQWWTQPFASPLLTIPNVGTIATPQDLMFYFGMGVAMAGILGNVVNILRMPRANNVVRPFLALAVHFGLTALFVVVTNMFPDGVKNAAPYAHEFVFGLLNSITATRLTISRLCMAPYAPISWYSMAFASLFGAELVLLLLGMFTPSMALICGWAAYGVSAFGLVFYVHMIVAVFRQIATHQKIHVLSLTAEQKRKALEAVQK